MNGVFDPNIYIKTIFIVGCGGTGATTARIVARILYDMQRTRKQTPQLVLVDHDIVEVKNIGRQLFSPAEEGRFKAEAIARRLSFALGLDVAWIAEPIASHHVDAYGGNLIISCVDSHLARVTINKLPGVLIASGNHHDTGQVCIGNTDDTDLVRRHIGSDHYPYLPKEGLLFPKLLEPDPMPQPAVSCAEQIKTGEQSLLVNDWQANVIAGYVYKLLHRQSITSFLTFINSQDGVVMNKSICPAELEVYL
jgi:PRTRC genetic system ThiF family protein